ncbi:MAG: hypothetical protein ACT4OV_03525 [Microthrixaceae bacterium]
MGRLAIAVAIALVLLAEAGTNLPASSLQRRVGPTASRIVQWAAFEQTWAVFAPNPRDTSLDLEAEVTFADGTTALWTMPDGPIVGTNLRYYRWRKWLEWVRADAQWTLWEPTARWIASEHAGRASPVVQVDLIRRFHRNLVDGPQPPWRSFTYYSLRLEASA